jgi:hypothetical protein
MLIGCTLYLFLMETGNYLCYVHACQCACFLSLYNTALEEFWEESDHKKSWIPYRHNALKYAVVKDQGFLLLHITKLFSENSV